MKTNFEIGNDLTLLLVYLLLTFDPAGLVISDTFSIVRVVTKEGSVEQGHVLVGPSAVNSL